MSQSCHIILTPTQPVGGGRSQRESNPGPPPQESRARPTELPPPPPPPHTHTQRRKGDFKNTCNTYALRTFDVNHFNILLLVLSESSIGKNRQFRYQTKYRMHFFLSERGNSYSLTIDILVSAITSNLVHIISKSNDNIY